MTTTDLPTPPPTPDQSADPAPRETAPPPDAHACDECYGFNPHLCPYNTGGQR